MGLGIKQKLNITLKEFGINSLIKLLQLSLFFFLAYTPWVHAFDNFVLKELEIRTFQSFSSMCYNYSKDLPTSPDTFKCRRSFDSLYVDGRIEGVMLDEMALWGSSKGYIFPGQLPLKKIYLNSKGGVMFNHKGNSVTTVDIIKFIKEKKLETYAGAECKSACVPIFTSGLVRKASPKTRFMVHNPRLSEAHLLFLQSKCGDLLDLESCREEMAKIQAIQIVDMDLYFDLLEYDGVSMTLRRDYLAGKKDSQAPLKGNLIGIRDLYFDGQAALNYGVALELFKD